MRVVWIVTAHNTCLIQTLAFFLFSPSFFPLSLSIYISLGLITPSLYIDTSFLSYPSLLPSPPALPFILYYTVLFL